MIRLLIKNKNKDLSIPMYMFCSTYGYSCILLIAIVPTGTPVSVK